MTSRTMAVKTIITMKIVITVITVIVMAILINASFMAQAGTSLPETIRVGLKNGTTATASVRISASDGLEFGYDTRNGFIGLYTHAGKGSIHVRKDSFFSDSNGLLIETRSGDMPASGNAFGPYHLQISGTFSVKQKAEELLEEILKTGLDGYLAYDNGWKVWVGRYVTEQTMEYSKTELKNWLDDAYEIQPVYPSNGRLQLNDDNGKILFMFEGSDGFFITMALDGNPINVDGKKFRGDIEFKRYGEGGITVVNSLPLQHYLYGVVPKEISPDWHTEILKAQAVAARNFAVANLNKHGKHGFDVCSGTDCQVYGGLNSESPFTNAAVDETEGQMIYYEGKPITAYFHNSSGGQTEDSENVWSIYLPYIKAVDDSFACNSPNDNWQKVYTSQQISSILAGHGINIGNIRSIKVDDYTRSGRSLTLTIQGSRGSTVLEKERSRAVFGYNELKSTLFTVETDSDLFILDGVGNPVQKLRAAEAVAISAGATKPLSDSPDTLAVHNGKDCATVNKYPTRFIFNGKGWGHGLGMSQWGAKGMAEAGYSYIDILQYYYQGCVVQ